MVNIKLVGHDYRYEIEEIINLFFSHEVNYEIVSILTLNDNILAQSEVYTEGRLISKEQEKRDIKDINNDIELRKLSKRILKLSLFNALEKINNKSIPWGILTGIRPTKIVHEMLEKGLNQSQIIKLLNKDFKINQDKAKLLLNVAGTELKVLKKTNPNSISMYIGIPFCPTRCLYCSFTSNPIKKYNHLIDRYVDTLCHEIDGVKTIIQSMGQTIQTIYIGGGTPTSLEVEQIKKLLEKLNDKFNLKELKEFTVEAGRPDSITKEKLEVIKEYNVSRISINPQTMNQVTLNLIGRQHTSKDIIDKFNLAREMGFKNINMDIIIGLPNENEVNIIRTMKELSKLEPDSITVHTMAIKRASDLKQNIKEYNMTSSSTVQNMIDIAKQYSFDMGMHPYYLYRQKNMVGNFENVGYCKNGYECIYNIQIMKEQQSIIALGAGAVSKIVGIKENKIERIFNVKDVEEYISRIDEMIQRKNAMI